MPAGEQERRGKWNAHVHQHAMRVSVPHPGLGHRWDHAAPGEQNGPRSVVGHERLCGGRLERETDVCQAGRVPRAVDRPGVGPRAPRMRGPHQNQVVRAPFHVGGVVKGLLQSPGYRSPVAPGATWDGKGCGVNLRPCAVGSASRVAYNHPPRTVRRCGSRHVYANRSWSGPPCCAGTPRWLADPGGGASGRPRAPSRSMIRSRTRPCPLGRSPVRPTAPWIHRAAEKACGARGTCPLCARRTIPDGQSRASVWSSGPSAPHHEPALVKKVRWIGGDPHYGFPGSPCSRVPVLAQDGPPSTANEARSQANSSAR